MLCTKKMDALELNEAVTKHNARLVWTGIVIGILMFKQLLAPKFDSAKRPFKDWAKRFAAGDLHL